MTDSPHLGLPFLVAEQSLKHITHNSALQALDTLVQLAVLDRTLAAPPASPVEGDRHIVAVGATGDWSAKDGMIAARQNGAWTFHQPRAGWRAWVASEAALLVFDGTSWLSLADPVPRVGINTLADATNRLAIKSDAILFSHDDVTPGSGDMQVKLNKASAADTASLLFQTGYSGRAEFGLAGDDDCHVKVSPNGSSWMEALVVDCHTGVVSFPQGIVGGGANPNLLNNGSFRIAQRLPQGATIWTAATFPVNNDGAYLFDRWVLLSDGNDVVEIGREASVVPAGALYACSLNVKTANKKFGILQLVERSDMAHVVGDSVTLTFWAKVSATTRLDNLKAAIVSWTGGADAPTRDIVSSWGAEGTNPTLAANFTYENTPANLNPTTTWQSFAITAAIDTAGVKNLAVFIFSDVTDTTAGDLLYIAEVKLEKGTIATANQPRPLAEELALCLRHAQVFGPGANNTAIAGVGYAISTTLAVYHLTLLAPMRTNAPALTVSSVAHWSLFNGANSPTTASALSVSAPDNGTIMWLGTIGAANFTAGQGSRIQANTSSARLVLSCDLGV